ncbi:MAG: PEP-CTERM sorting domain-containing protein [Novosphingobium sp.]|nr:PEP-CTERM sorting domain-containing protein [Novosphingobium sp.]
MIKPAIAIGLSLLLTAPAHAAGVVSLPDPSGLMLFSLGVVGVIVGRQASRKRPRD